MAEARAGLLLGISMLGALPCFAAPPPTALDPHAAPSAALSPPVAAPPAPLASSPGPAPAIPTAAVEIPRPPAEPPAWGVRSGALFRFEGSLGPLVVGTFPQNPPLPDPPPLEPGPLPVPNSCGVGGQVTLGFRYVTPYRPALNPTILGLLKIPILGLLLIPFVPVFVITSSLVSGDQLGLDLRFAILAPCGSEAVRYAVGLRPVLRVARHDSRVRLPSLLGMVLPEPLLIFENQQPVMLELGLLRLPIAVLLTSHIGVELEPSLGYRISFSPGIPSAVTLGIHASLVVR